MSHNSSSHKVNFEPKMVQKAQLILGSLLLFLTIVLIAGIYQGVNSGDFERVLLKPFREFASDLEKASQTPSPKSQEAPATDSASLSPTPSSSTINNSVQVNQKTKVVVSNCTRKNIREGEFASNKCYTGKDYEDLEYYLGQYNSAVFDRDGEESFIKITCPGMSDMFKQSCEEHKQKKAEAEASISKYRGIVLGIIAKGR